MLINVKLNDTVHKMLWEESVHMCIRNIMATTGSTRSPFGDLYGEKTNDHWFVLRFWTYQIHH